MVNKEILKQMGFGKGDNPGNKESWYHDSGCWVYFNSDEQTVLDMILDVGYTLTATNKLFWIIFMVIIHFA